LEPETSVSTEVGAIYDNLKGFSAGLTFFQSEYKDFISTDGPALLKCETGVNDAACEAFLLDLGAAWQMGYYRDRNNALQPDSFTLRRPINLDEAKIQGAELFTRLQINPQWSV